MKRLTPERLEEIRKDNCFGVCQECSHKIALLDEIDALQENLDEEIRINQMGAAREEMLLTGPDGLNSLKHRVTMYLATIEKLEAEVATLREELSDAYKAAGDIARERDRFHEENDYFRESRSKDDAELHGLRKKDEDYLLETTRGDHP